MVKLFLFDFDGCVSPHKIYSKDGLCSGKIVKDVDWSALKRFKAAGVAVEAITGDNWNEDILYNRNISYTLSRGKNKEDFLKDVCERNKCKPSDVAYIGDDIFDIGLLQKVGYPFAPLDATEDVFNITFAKRLGRKGGEGVIDELFYYLRDNGKIKKLPFKEEFQKILELDTLQKF